MKKENGRLNAKTGIGRMVRLVFIIMAMTCMNACAYLTAASWKEEVLLHDGSKIIAKRWQMHGGRHELGQESPISDQSISFTIPGTDKTLKWKDEASDELYGVANFDLAALHILNNMPYIITTPNLCLSYNKWGRPNPPYIIFKYEGNEWKQIDIAELPAEFKNINLVINVLKHEKKLLSQGVTSAEMVKELNSSLTQAEYKTIVRTPTEGRNCMAMIHDGHGSWFNSGYFSARSNYEACMKVCEQEKMTSQYCPCDRFFKGKTKEK